MVDPTLVISIPRLLLPGSLDPLVFSGTQDENPLGISDFAEPPLTPRIVGVENDAPVHGSTPLRWSYQDTTLQWATYPDADDETDVQAFFAEIQAAITQGLRFPVHVTISDAPTKVWSCQPGTITPEARSRPNLANHDPSWTILLPCNPIPGTV